MSQYPGFGYALVKMHGCGYGYGYRLVEAYRYEFSVQCPRRFFRDPEILQTFYMPVPNRLRFSFFSRYTKYTCDSVCFGIFGSSSHFFAEKKKKALSVHQGHIKHVCKISGSISKTAWTFGPLCGNRAKITASHRNYLVSFKIRFWALNMT